MKEMEGKKYLKSTILLKTEKSQPSRGAAENQLKMCLQVWLDAKSQKQDLSVRRASRQRAVFRRKAVGSGEMGDI